MQRIFFVSGLPRSGSTLLLNLLGQNSDHYVTPTSGLVDLFAGVRDAWPKNVSFQAQGIEIVKPRIESSLKGLITGFYAKEITEGRIIFDKSRGWPAYSEALDAAFGEPQKIVLTLRDVRAVLASFEKLYRKNPMTRHAVLGDDFYRMQTTEGRARVLLSPTGVVGLAINRVRDLLQRGRANRAVIVPYSQLTENPRLVLEGLHRALGIPSFPYDPDNVKQITKEDDDLHGWGDLHTIRPRVERPTNVPWDGVLPQAFADRIAEEYGDINHLST